MGLENNLQLKNSFSKMLIAENCLIKKTDHVKRHQLRILHKFKFPGTIKAVMSLALLKRDNTT